MNNFKGSNFQKAVVGFKKKPHYKLPKKKLDTIWGQFIMGLFLYQTEKF